MNQLVQPDTELRRKTLPVLAFQGEGMGPFLCLSFRVPAVGDLVLSSGAVHARRPRLGDYLNPHPSGILVPFIEALPLDLEPWVKPRGSYPRRVEQHRMEIRRWDWLYQQAVLLMTGTIIGFLDIRLRSEEMSVETVATSALDLCSAYGAMW